MRSDMEVMRNEERRRVDELQEDKQDDIITLQENGFEGSLFDDQGKLTDEVRSLLIEPDSTALSLYFDIKGNKIGRGVDRSSKSTSWTVNEPNMKPLPQVAKQ
jgi:hypothetical protein